jgi:hypothetical protein
MFVREHPARRQRLFFPENTPPSRLSESQAQKSRSQGSYGKLSSAILRRWRFLALFHSTSVAGQVVPRWVLHTLRDPNSRTSGS